MICVPLNHKADRNGWLAIDVIVAVGERTNTPDHGIVLWNTSVTRPRPRETATPICSPTLSAWNGIRCRLPVGSVYSPAPRSAGSPVSLRASAASLAVPMVRPVTGSIVLAFLRAHAVLGESAMALKVSLYLPKPFEIGCVAPWR